MGMNNNNLCDSCTNIGCIYMFQSSNIIKSECAFYMPPHLESDSCGNYIVTQSTTEVIPKEQNEARLKADMYDKDTVLWMFRELQLEIEEMPHYIVEHMKGAYINYKDTLQIIQQKIDELKEDSDGV